MSLLNSYQKYMLSCEKDLSSRVLPHSNENYFIDLSSNNYLGLARNPEVIRSGCEAALKYGAGTTGSRLLSGNNELFEIFENIIALDKHFEASLIFNSGYQANIGVLSALSSKDTYVIFDKLNHASMYQGVFASGCTLLRYKHLDYDHLEDILKNLDNKKIIIASETVFGMDGDIADLQNLSLLSDKYGAILYLDEAHATGLYGKNGYGLSTDFTLNQEQTLVMGTFSKALGSSGAYLSCSKFLKNYLIQTCKSFIYSTSLSPFCIGAAKTAWEKIRNMRDTRAELLKKTAFFRQKIKGVGEGTNIVPLICENTSYMLNLKQKLLDKGILVSGIRPPTSPTPRIRMAVCSYHTASDLKSVSDAFDGGLSVTFGKNM